MRFVIAEEGHVVNILPPVDTAGGKNSDVFSMKNWNHAAIIVTFGATDADAGNVTVEACDDFTPSNVQAIGFNYYAETTAAGDTLGARTTVATADAATGIDVSANDNIMYVIELDAIELPAGKPNVRLVFSAPGGANLGQAVAVLSGGRYETVQSATVIA